MRLFRGCPPLGTLVRILLWGFVPALVLAIAITGFHQSGRASNERAAGAAMKTLTSAEADFRANDRDGNGVNDFWTGDVAGLYTLKNLRLIEPELAAADGAPLLPLSRKPESRQGYRYQALVYDNSTKGDEKEYRQSTVQGGPAQFNPSRFGFVGYPASSYAGVFQYLINEGNTIFRLKIEEHGLLLEWPSDGFFRSLETPRMSRMGDD